MSVTVLVVDTSYLLELFKVPDYFDPGFSEKVKQRFKKAAKAGHRFYVPFAVVFEVANHIADGRNDVRRAELAEQLARTVRQSVEKGTPWVIVPAPEDILLHVSELPRLCDVYAAEFADQRIGLSDTAIIESSRRLKAKYGSFGNLVHIWTKDKRMKRHEPDPEPEPLVE
jgi:predicted nucleic acid-binding protein